MQEGRSETRSRTRSPGARRTGGRSVRPTGPTRRIASGPAVWLVLGLLATLVGCRSSGVSATRDVDPDTITFEELADWHDDSALDVVRRLRPQWLRARASSAGPVSGPVEPVVRIDGVPLRSVSELGDVPAADVATMRFMSGPDATLRFGTGYGYGAILVTTRTGSRQDAVD